MKIFISFFLFAFAQITFAQTSDAKLTRILTEYRESISEKEVDRFQRLFFSRKVPFIGVMSAKTKMAAQADYPNIDGTAISDNSEFINSIANSDSEQKEKFYNVKKQSDGTVANVSFDYTFHVDGEMKQWGKEKWNLIYKDKKWLITNVVYSIHFPSVEQCPFTENAISSNPKIPVAKPKKRIPKVQTPPRNSKIDAKIAEKEDEDEDDYKEDLEEDEEAQEVKAKPKKRPFKVFANDEKWGKLYVGAKNKVVIEYEGTDPSRISIFCSEKQVAIQRLEDHTYIIKPSSEVKEFPVYVRIGNKNINYTFKTTTLPVPLAMFGKRYSGNFPLSTFEDQFGLLTNERGFPVKAKCRVMGFKLTRKSPSGKTDFVVNNGARFTDKSEQFIKTLKKNDVVRFENIQCWCPGYGEDYQQLKDLEFTLK